MATPERKADLPIDEEALKASEEKYRHLFETMTQGIVYQSADGKIVSANPAAERILGLTLDQLMGKTSMDPGWKSIREDGSELPGDEHPAMVALRTGRPVGPFVFSVYQPRKQAHTWISVVAKPMFRPGERQPYQVYAMFDDITEKRKADETVLKHVQEKELILKEVHHRIKNNMGTMLSLLSIQANSVGDGAAKKALMDAAARIASMGVLYDKLYRSENHNEVSLKVFVPSLLKQIMAIFPHKDRIEIATEVEDLVLNPAILSPIGILLNELVTNSIKHAFDDRDGGTIAIRCFRKDGRIVLEYEDDGPGLPDTAKLDRSSGFGLQLIGLLAAQLNGTMSIVRGRGARFVLELPDTSVSPTPSDGMATR